MEPGLERGLSDIEPGETRSWDVRHDLAELLDLLVELRGRAESFEADARDVGATALHQMMREIHAATLMWGERAASLLEKEPGEHLHLDRVEEQSMESFPASDPPSSY
jgi:hypothetical protein